MRNLLGTHMGHATLITMCRILQEPCLKDDTGLLRGAVFFVNMGLWGSQPVTNLKSPPSAVLPSIMAVRFYYEIYIFFYKVRKLYFFQAVKWNQPPVAYEIVLAMHRLVYKHGFELLDPAWDSILTILSIIADMLHQYGKLKNLFSLNNFSESNFIFVNMNKLV